MSNAYQLVSETLNEMSASLLKRAASAASKKAFRAAKLVNRTNPAYVRNTSGAQKKAFGKAFDIMQRNKDRSNKFLSHIK